MHRDRFRRDVPGGTKGCSSKEANTEGPTNEQHLRDDQNYKKTTITKLTTNFVEIPRPTIQRLLVEMAEGASTDGTTNAQCLFDVHNYKMTTITKLPTDFVETPETDDSASVG